MTAPDHMPEMFENRLHEPGHPHMEPPANPARFRTLDKDADSIRYAFFTGDSLIEQRRRKGIRIMRHDIHRASAEAVAWEDGKLRRLARVDMRRDLLEAFSIKLSRKDIVVIELNIRSTRVRWPQL